MKRILGFLLSLLFCTSFATALPVSALDEEHIERFDAAVHIGKDGIATITETIDYDFGVEERHGIYRDIPIDYYDNAKSYYLNFSLKSITDGSGASYKYQKYTEDGNARLKIGDPDTTITGVHRYVISYTLSPVVYIKDGRQFLNLDVYGEGWDVPTAHFSAKVTLDGDAKLRDVVWYGPTTQVTGTPDISLSDIPTRSAVTINADLPDNYTKNLLIEGKRRPIDVWAIIGEYAGLIFMVLGFGAAGIIIFIRWFVAKSKRSSQTVIPEYEPPTGMLPAEIGLLQDDTTDAKEITATVVDFAVRGGLKIERTEKSILGFKSAEFTLTKLTRPADLTTQEMVLYNALFGSGDTVKVKDLKIPVQVQTFRTEIKERLTEKGYYQKSGNLFLLGTLTDEGAKQWAKVDGFKLYLGVTEKDRLKFTDAPDKTPERFNALLPYAIAFGVEKEWAKQFEGIDLSQSSSWYTGGNMAAFSAGSLASDLGSSLASSVSSNSSFSSSGGSSGGGSGGGGGGSW